LKSKAFLFIITAALSSGLLLGLSFIFPPLALLAFVAISPMLWAASKTNLAFFSALAFFSNLLAVLLLLPELQWQSASITFQYITIQTLLWTSPWVIYQVVRGRSNQKLGYIALVSSWLLLEWTAGQTWGNWQGLQLGYAPATVAALIQWYDILGTTGGSLWVLAINIQLYRIIWPSMPHARRAGILNGSAVLLLPIIASLIMGIYNASPLKNSVKMFAVASIHATNTETVELPIFLSAGDITKFGNAKILAAQGKQDNAFWYKAAIDTIVNAVYTKEGTQTAIVGKNVMTIGIAGNRWQTMVFADFAGYRCGLLNAGSFMRTETVRLYAQQDAELLCGFSYDSDYFVAWRRQVIASAKAIENRKNVLIFNPDGNAYLIHPSGKTFVLNSSNTIEKTKPAPVCDSFFSAYGDLVGRLSIFVTAWLLLGSFVKPFRNR